MLGMLALSITGELYLPIKNRVEELFLAAKVSYKDKDNHQVIIYVDGLDEADCIKLTWFIKGFDEGHAYGLNCRLG
jgi:hypothetical protein